MPSYKKNYGKNYEEIIGKTKVDYILYSSGTVVIHTTCSNYPFKVETEEDKLKLIGYFGQIRAGLIHLLNDSRERIVPTISEWEVTECDFNKDIKVSDYFHMTALKIRIKHLDHLLGLYVKAMGQDTVLRVEETKHPNDGRLSSVGYTQKILDTRDLSQINLTYNNITFQICPDSGFTNEQRSETQTRPSKNELDRYNLSQE